MKLINKLVLFTLLGASVGTLTSCDNDLLAINTNENNPEIVPTSTIFNGANRYLMNYTRDGWWSARMSLPWMQYSSQNNYLEEDKYQYRDAQTSNGWTYLYRAANNYKDIIQRCEDPATTVQMSAYGNIQNQIATSRIMLAYTFDNLVTHFGDIPYWSYGQKNNPRFQALQIDAYTVPAYATQEEIYADLLNELKAAADQIVEGGSISGDNIYNGDASKWKKFANSLRLRIANRLKDKMPAAQTHISEAIAGGVFSNNDESATHKFGTADAEGNPFWKLFYVDNRTDFYVNQTFVELLKGEKGSYGLDPRLFELVAPKGLTFTQYKTTDKWYKSVDDGGYGLVEGDLNNYTGMPYGQPTVDTYYGLSSNVNFFSHNYKKINKAEVLMDYAEVEFILAELNGWSQANYIAGVRANMEYWEVKPEMIEAYIANLPAANQEHVMNQKYIALLGNADEAWNEYRRTGYPNTSILLMPGETNTRPNGTTYVFTPLMSGNVIATDIPGRVRYPIGQQTLNRVNWTEASSRLSNGDEINSKLYFAR
ncbi:SusD/RagB family nutrient-binding outer membrane lipoprotein [Faecalibacter rhinopitheci]|uniref:SusD/RagB family nutrient-binding outer membrane lipoprotein n=1 Tax=Faecalibacter rhinopitheci TaxID=2779678 RepID=A0A8J7K3T9_9FLAO|nr:SusD/RagB family nutrient-binding outer membrane lipoprotein [Faecalibacter rhinopitheci]MBF0596569.1 SusD/RagB family nutrient-binding outer membrane lipoprotein [Faecalibacter rhinopitheci]